MITYRSRSIHVGSAKPLLMKRMSITILTTLAMAQSLQAEPIREIGQTELRLNVTSGKSVGMGQVLSTVHDRFDGDAVDVRAFEAGRVYYRILVRRTDGRIHSVVIEAQSGALVSPESPLAQELALAATGGLQIIGQDEPSTSVSEMISAEDKPESGDNI